LTGTFKRNEYNRNKFYLFEASSELVAESGVNERIYAAVDETCPMDSEHCEEELRFAQKTVSLQLSDGCNGIEWCPTNPERKCDQHYHARHLARNSKQRGRYLISFLKPDH
jgi:hypothetical protein